jgi:DnaD/phage-associated family protein
VENAEFVQWLWGNGQVVLPLPLLKKMQSLNLSPEDIGCLALAMARCRENLSPGELTADKWIRWSLAQGWAQWQGQGEKKALVFTPLWRSLYQSWQEDEKAPAECAAKSKGTFDYGRILKWLDQERGTLSLNLREKQVIQEFNLKYGWSTEFILAFLQLAFERGHNRLMNYQPVAKRVYENGVDTVEGLIAFIDNYDWIQYKVAEVKKCIGQYGGVTKAQREFYLKWQNTWKFGHELIMRAAEEAGAASSPSFKYMDSVLASWHEKGVEDISGAEQAILEHDRRDKPSLHAPAGKKKSSRADYRDWENI